MTPSFRARLREMAEAATPGPWHVQSWKDSHVAGVLSNHPEPAGSIVTEAYKANAAFIAAANPQTVLALLDEVERLHARVQEEQDNRDYVAKERDAARLECHERRFDRNLVREIGNLRDQLSAAQAEVERLHQEVAREVIKGDDIDAELAAMTAARDEACDIAVDALGATNYDYDYGSAKQRIAELRKVGSNG